ncbi:MAG: hypothetical protein EOP44_03075 [Sphingobacteriaceae bacterium]|nr:MAG: hypothetical protein EOP44_03075 [Sphingobacteriaceae bacterium]
MEVTFKNVDPEDFSLLKQLSQRLGIEVETKPEEMIDPPDNPSVLDDLRESMAEIRHAQTNNIKMQSARDLLNEL